MAPPNLKVLVADDDELFRTFIEHKLLSYAYDVVLCTNGQEAIDLLMQETFDVILLDYKMPERSGLNVLQWMHEQKNNTPVIVLTGEGSEHIAVEAMKLGAYAYLQKGTADMERIDGEIQAANGQHMLNEEKAAASTNQTSATEEQHLTEMVDSVASVVLNSLATMRMKMDESEQELTQFTTGTQQENIKSIWSELKNDQELVTSAVMTLLSISKVVEGEKKMSFTAAQVEEFKKKFSEKI